jgi:hypothetical protein
MPYALVPRGGGGTLSEREHVILEALLAGIERVAQAIGRVEILLSNQATLQQRCEAAEEKLKALRDSSNRRSAKSKRQRVGNVARQVLSISTSSREKEKKKEPVGNVSATLPSPAGYPDLIAHFAETLKRIASADYKFQPEHGKHVKALLRDYGLDEAKRLVDLAAERYGRDRFWREKGFTFRRIVTDAEALSTSRPKPQPVRDLEREDLRAFAAAHPEYAEDEVLDRWHEQRRAVP